MLYQTTMPSPVGVLTLFASDVGLRAILWDNGWADRIAVGESVNGPDPAGVLVTAVSQLAEYFDGTRREFDLPLDPVGTQFQQSVWVALRTVPYGETISYGEQARRLGDPRKARAVGSANGRNPLSIVVPCHRVVGSNGALVGFGGGLTSKAWLLDHERFVG